MAKSCSTLFLSAILLLLTACAGQEKLDTSTPDGLYEMAEKMAKDERYEEAITYYNEIKNKHPYSRFAVSAKLKIADIEFKRENYVEAEIAYKIFRELHPDHERADFVLLHIGLSIFHQLPATFDRDLSGATMAMDYFKQLLEYFPKSAHAETAKQHLSKCEQLLADKQSYIAEYYFKREHWQSALGRFEDILRSHSNKGYDTRALYGATIASYRLKNMDLAKSYFKRLLAEHPNSQEVNTARNELADGF